jgi:hypothetical protein
VSRSLTPPALHRALPFAPFALVQKLIAEIAVLAAEVNNVFDQARIGAGGKA